MDSREQGQENAREVDQWLDEAIALYSRVEPRAGLEGRVLAHLAAERRQSSRSLRWWGVFAFSSAAVALALLWLGRMDRGLTVSGPIAKVAVPVGDRAMHVDPSPARTVATQDRCKVVRHKLAHATQSNASPKLEQFPSPEPLSEQEKILMSYVAKYPETAALVAQARTEALEQDRKEEEVEAAQGSSE